VNRASLVNGDDFLWIPFFIDVRPLDADQIMNLLDYMENKLNGQHWRTQELTLAVLSDRINEANEVFKWTGAYLSLTILDTGVMRISASAEVEGGTTVYAYDQIISLIDKVVVHEVL
jgi:hypothetical protein